MLQRRRIFFSALFPRPFPPSKTILILHDTSFGSVASGVYRHLGCSEHSKSRFPPGRGFLKAKIPPRGGNGLLTEQPTPAFQRQFLSHPWADCTDASSAVKLPPRGFFQEAGWKKRNRPVPNEKILSLRTEGKEKSDRGSWPGGWKNCLVFGPLGREPPSSENATSYSHKR